MDDQDINAATLDRRIEQGRESNLFVNRNSWETLVQKTSSSHFLMKISKRHITLCSFSQPSGGSACPVVPCLLWRHGAFCT